MKLLRKSGMRLNKKGKKIYYGIYLCSFCLKEVEKDLSNGGRMKSCGCYRIESIKIHGETYTRLYSIWTNMKTRCLNPNREAYKDYGGRGITICPEWTNDYIAFRDWSLNNGYRENLQINRKNNNGNYEPGNCNWITRTENMRNTRRIKNSLKIANEIRDLYNTGDYTQKELAEKCKMRPDTICDIINNEIWINL